MISYPRLWSSIFVKNDHRDFVAACLERSREVPLAVHLDLGHGDYEEYPDCTCIRNMWSSGMRINERNPCRYHTTIDPLIEVDTIGRIRTLDVSLALLDDSVEEDPDRYFKSVLEDFELFTFSLPTLESLSFSVGLELEIETHLEFPEDMFCLESSPPPNLRHLTLHGCYGGPIRAVRNLTSFKLTGGGCAVDPIELDQFTFLPFISANRSLVSLSLSHCVFPDRAELSLVTPVKLPELKSLRLADIHGLPGFLGLVDIPAFKTLSSLRASVRGDNFSLNTQVHAGSDDGFQLSYSPPGNPGTASDWLSITPGADPSVAVVRFEGRQPVLGLGNKMGTLPLSLLVKAKVLEIGASFADLSYSDFWEDLEKVGPQLTTLRLEVIRGMKPGVSTLVEELVRVRFNKGMPLVNLEKMMFEGMSEEGEERAKKLWGEFRAGLNIDQYLAPQ